MRAGGVVCSFILFLRQEHLTEIFFDCKTAFFSVVIETFQPKTPDSSSAYEPLFGDEIEKDKNFSDMRKLHNDVVDEFLKAIIIDKPSKL